MLNFTITKYIIFYTTKIKQYLLQDPKYSFDLNNNKMEKVNNWKVHSMIFPENLSWEKHIDQLICTCYKKLFILKKKWNDLRKKKLENILLKLLSFRKLTMEIKFVLIHHKIPWCYYKRYWKQLVFSEMVTTVIHLV